MKFYQCPKCDQTYIKLIDQYKQMTCCNTATVELMENENEEERQNHDVDIRKVGRFITISLKEEHPMVDIHHIEFICIETSTGFQFKQFQLEDVLKAEFILAKDEEVVNVYVYCNVHSLWRFGPQNLS